MTTDHAEEPTAPRVLIADDDPGIVRFLSARCAKLGFNVEPATNGLQALIIASHFHPDVLIIDINMPEVDGLSVAARMLRPNRRPLEVIVVTASTFAETTARCEAFGAIHVRKGVDLWRRVRAALIDLYPQIAGKANEPVPSLQVPAGAREFPRILIVGTSMVMKSFLSSRLSKFGIASVFAADAIQGYRAAAREDPSAIITSYALPGGDAEYLMLKLRSSAATRNTPVLVISPDPLDEFVEARLSDRWQRAVHFFRVPFEVEDVFAVLQKYCAFTIAPNPFDRIDEASAVRLEDARVQHRSR